MRNFPQAVTDALASGHVELRALVQLQLSTPIYACTGQQITYAGNVYTPDSGLEDVPDISQDFVLSSSSMTLTFSDVTDTLLALAVSGGYSGAQLDIHIAVLNPADMSLLHVIPSVYRGYCEDLQPSETGKVAFSFANHMHRFDRTAGRRTNTSSQQRFFPADNGFEQVTQSSGDWL